MLIYLGGTRILGILVPMDDHQGVELTKLIRPRLTLPIHYDDYPVFRSPLPAFLGLARHEGIGAAIRPIYRGETVTLPQLAAPPPA